MVGSLSGMQVAIPVTDGFAQSELTEPKKVWNKPARSALIISPPGGKQLRGWKHTEWGDSFPLDVALDEAQPDDYSALLLPGGVINPDHPPLEPARSRIRESVHRRQQANRGEICHGPCTLIEAGAVRKRKITSSPSLRRT